MIIYTGNQTFQLQQCQFLGQNFYLQHLRPLFWFLLTILSILSLTIFPLISVHHQISAATPSFKRLTSKCRFFQKPVHYLTVTKKKCIWGKYIYNEAIQITSSSGIYKTNIYHKDCYLQLFVFKFHMSNTSFFKNKRLPLLSATL